MVDRRGLIINTESLIKDSELRAIAPRNMSISPWYRGRARVDKRKEEDGREEGGD